MKGGATVQHPQQAKNQNYVLDPHRKLVWLVMTISCILIASYYTEILLSMTKDKMLYLI